MPFGDATFAADSHAFGVVVASSLQSPWTATYGLGGLLTLALATGEPRYLAAAALLAAWLRDKLDHATAAAGPRAVQDLAGDVVTVASGTAWDLEPEAYRPDAARLLGWLTSPPADLDRRHRSWFEARTGHDLERLLADRADLYWAHVTFVYSWNAPPPSSPSTSARSPPRSTPSPRPMP